MKIAHAVSVPERSICCVQSERRRGRFSFSRFGERESPGPWQNRGTWPICRGGCHANVSKLTIHEFRAAGRDTGDRRQRLVRAVEVLGGPGDHPATDGHGTEVLCGTAEGPDGHPGRVLRAASGRARGTGLPAGADRASGTVTAARTGQRRRRVTPACAVAACHWGWWATRRHEKTRADICSGPAARRHEP